MGIVILHLIPFVHIKAKAYWDFDIHIAHCKGNVPHFGIEDNKFPQNGVRTNKLRSWRGPKIHPLYSIVNILGISTYNSYCVLINMVVDNTLDNASYHNHRMSNPDTGMMFLEHGFSIKTIWQKLILYLRCAKSGGGEGAIFENAFKRSNRIIVELQSRRKAKSLTIAVTRCCTHRKKTYRPQTACLMFCVFPSHSFRLTLRFP